MSAVQVVARVTGNEPARAYRRVLLQAPEVARAARPGQFVALAVGDAPTATLLRRSFSLHAADPSTGTVEIVVADAGPGSGWVTRRRPGDVVDLVGPLGRPFPLPDDAGAPCVLVGGGYGSAPLLWWAGELRGRGHRVDLVLGAATQARLFGVDEGRYPAAEVADAVHLTTDDGSAGLAGRVTDALAGLLPDANPQGAVVPRETVQVYACGPMAMLRAVAALAAARGARAWCAVEEAMACGIGVCMTCVLPVRGADGVTRMTRSCVDGPTFAGDAVRWDAVTLTPHGSGSTVPADCFGAAVPGGH